MKYIPKSIKRIGYDGVCIEWQDGDLIELNSIKLRDNCPAADSRAKRGDTSHDKPFSGRGRLSVISHSRDEELKLLKIWPVGRYAIGVEWGDGHNSGIYDYDLLHELCYGKES